MGIEYQGCNIPTSFASCSIPPYFNATLPQKLEAIRSAGFDGIEISMPDILTYGGDIEGRTIDESDYDAISGVGGKIRILTEQLGLTILMLQPFSRFEGWPRDTHAGEREAAFDRARGWIKVMEALGTDMLQVGCNIPPRVTSLIRRRLTSLLAGRLNRRTRCVAMSGPARRGLGRAG